MAECRRCGKNIRFHPTKVAEAPGTVRGYKGTQLCVMCTRADLALQPPKPPETRLPKCHGCCKEMRPYKARLEGWPGTVARYSKTTCQSCIEKQRRGLPPYEIEARRLKVPELTESARRAAARVVLRSGGDILILRALGLEDVYAEVR